MSSIKLSPNASGTGEFTIAAPNSNTNRTLTLPDQTGTVLTNAGPFTANASASNGAVTIDASNNVGIGTSSPVPYGASNRVLQLDGGSVSAEIRLTNNTTGSSAVNGGLFQMAGNDFYIWNVENSFLSFGTNNAERARIDTSGRLLVGTTSAPGQTGGVVVANNELFVYNIPTTASGANCNISSGESNRFYRSTSALKYKQDIRDIESIDINKFRPVRYKSKCENDDQTKDHFGIIADEVHAAGITELVSYGADGEVEGFQYDRLTVVLLKAVQELNAKVAALEARLASDGPSNGAQA